MTSRREWLGTSLGAAASLALTPELLRALGALREPGGKLIQRAIPSSGELLPVIACGRQNLPPAEAAAIREVLQTLLDNGGKVLDTAHGGPEEQVTGRVVDELGIQNKIFWVTSVGVTTPLLPGYTGPPPKPSPDAVKARFEEKIAKFKSPKIDLVQILSPGTDLATHLAVLNDLRKQGRVRYIGVTELSPPANFRTTAPFLANMESIMRNEAIDFIGVDYSVGDRRVEERILPLAQERKIGVMAYFPFDRNRIFQRASTTPLPEWAADFDAKTWAQFFLKYVVSHPAVTAVRAGTTKASHMLDNIGGGIGRLPDEATRARMARLVDALPATPAPRPPAPQPQQQQQAARPAPVVLSTAILDRYVGEYTYPASYASVPANVAIRREGEQLLIKSGVAPEGPLVARSETMFATPWFSTIQFEVDGQGKVTSAIVEQGPFRIPLERK